MAHERALPLHLWKQIDVDTTHSSKKLVTFCSVGIMLNPTGGGAKFYPRVRVWL
jgi:hypothetical protein